MLYYQEAEEIQEESMDTLFLLVRIANEYLSQIITHIWAGKRLLHY